MDIRYLTNPQIDRQKWDACIDRSSNGLIYAYSYYLDAMAKHWDALVLGDYETVMPLTWNRKYRIHYLYQPAFTACLGVFGSSPGAALVNAFLNAVPSKFKYWDISLNEGNCFSLPDFRSYERKNYVLSLHAPYEKLYSNFRESTQRNIAKSVRLKCTVKKDLPVKEVIELSMQQSSAFAGLHHDDFENFDSLYKTLHPKKRALTYGVYSHDRLVASAAFFFSHNRAYYILVGNHPDGKTIGASHALIDAFIRDHAGKEIWLDFEGSDIRNLAFFYSSFGAVERKYAAIKLNRLPGWVKWMKG
jgi:hypothetical protein